MQPSPGVEGSTHTKSPISIPRFLPSFSKCPQQIGYYRCFSSSFRLCFFFVFVCWIELSNKSYLVISTRELGIPASPGRRRIPQLMNVTIAIIKTSHVFVSSSSPQHLDEKAASIVQDAPSCLSLWSLVVGGFMQIGFVLCVWQETQWRQVSPFFDLLCPSSCFVIGVCCTYCETKKKRRGTGKSDDWSRTNWTGVVTIYLPRDRISGRPNCIQFSVQNISNLLLFTWCIHARQVVGDGSKRWPHMRQNARLDVQAANVVRGQAGRDGGHQQRSQARSVRVSGTVQVPPMELHGYRQPQRIRSRRRCR